MTTRSKQEAAAASPTRKNGSRRGWLGWFGGSGKSKAAASQPTDLAHKQAAGTRAAATPAPAAATPATKPTAIEPRPEPEPEGMARPARGHEVAELVHALRSHIDHQSDRSERLLQSLDGLPDALRSIPEASRNGERMLEVMHAQQQQQQAHARQMTEAMNSVVEASRHRDQTIEMLQQQIVATQEKDTKLVQGFTLLGETMQKISAIQEKSADVLHRIADTAGQAETRMRHVVEMSRRQSRMGMLTGAAVALVLLAMTAFIAVSATRLASLPGQHPSAPAAIEAPPAIDLAPREEAPQRSTRAETPAITPTAVIGAPFGLDLLDRPFGALPDLDAEVLAPGAEPAELPSKPATPPDSAAADSTRLSTTDDDLHSTQRQAAATAEP